jgi:hypothetical protein
VYKGQTGVDLSTDRRVGTNIIANGVSSVSVTFAALPNTSYVVLAQMVNTVDVTPQFQPMTVTAKSTTGFTASFNAPTDSGNYKLDWLVLRF